MSELIATPVGTVMIYDRSDVMKLEGAEVFTIPSRSIENLNHKVTYWEKSWDCSCKGYRIHKHCYHINEVRKVVED